MENHIITQNNNVTKKKKKTKNFSCLLKSRSGSDYICYHPLTGGAKEPPYTQCQSRRFVLKGNPSEELEREG